MTEVNRLPLPTLDEHASSLPRGLSRSLAAQAAIFAELPDVIRANTPAAEVLFQRCRAATRHLATGSSVTATAMWSEPAAGMAR